MKHYDDILHLPHPVSKKRRQMPIADRAAQFMPFAALTGYEAALTETARLTSPRIELDDAQRELLNRQLCFLQSLAAEADSAGISRKPGILRCFGFRHAGCSGESTAKRASSCLPQEHTHRLEPRP